ncbi:MAG: methyl-accepting chemotaxis protein [Lachnospiraceae bacterium]|nr:methyl-accepting chemotaxis protein [Lachnospiraceae bacterium]
MRFSIRNKILLGSVPVNILICLIMGIFIYNHVSTSFVESAAADTLALTQVSAREINGNLLSLLEEGADDSYANTVTLETLESILSSGKIHSIYTVGERDGQMVYLSVPDGETPVGEAVEAVYVTEMRNAMASEGYVTNKIEKADGASFITAYAPVFDRNGSVVGILGIDYHAENIVETLHKIVMSIVTIGVLLVIVSVVISVIMASRISSGLKAVNNKVSDLVSNNGDLTQKIQVNSKDEVGDIAENINNLLEYIRTVVSSISGNSNRLSGSVETALNMTVRTNDQLVGVSATMEEMSAAMEETSASLQQVQFSTQQIQSDVDGLNVSVQRGTSYAQEMQGRAQQMCKNAAEETKIAETAAENMTKSLDEKIEKSKDVENISKLTQTILEIADETNLLSLNASIEAARAGEQGRGFAVVASEISSLATHSAETAKQIQIITEEVISNVKGLADESTKMVDFVKVKTIGGYRQLMDTGLQYQKDAEQVSDMLRSVEEASENIERSMESVNSAMDDVSRAVEESARGVSDVASSVSEMSSNMNQNREVVNENASIAQHLDSEVNKFKF